MKPSDKLDSAASIRPLRSALLMTAAYVVVCSLYIVVSTHLAAALARDVAELEHVEHIKGIVFIFVSGLIFFLFARHVLKRIERHERELIQNREALMAAERRAAAGVMASAVAHDLNNILTIVGAGVEELTESPATPHPLEAADQVQKAVQEMGTLTRRLMTVGRDGLAAEFAPGDLARSIHEAVQLALHHTKVRGCRVSVATPPEIETAHSLRLVSQMLLNLLINAAEATAGRGHIEVSAKIEGHAAHILVADDGPGLAESVREHLFEPFRTTKSGGNGGLGLLSVKAAVDAHGGRIDLAPSPLGGTAFLIQLPIRNAPAPPTRRLATPA